MHLRALRDPALAAVTSADEFRFSALFERPTVLVVELPQGGVEKLRPYVNLFFAQLFREAAQCATASAGCRLPRPLNLYLDDFAAAIGRIPDFGQHLNLSRSRDVRVVAAVQSLSQIEHHYGTEARDILAGFGTTLFKSPEQHDAEWASRQSGTCTVEAVDEVVEEAEFGDERRGVGRTVRGVARPLLLPEEIRYAPEHVLDGRAWTVFFPETPPVQLFLRAAHELPEMAGAMADAFVRPRSAKLREKPLRYRPAGLVCAQAEMSHEEVMKRLCEVKETLGFADAPSVAVEWWDAFEAMCEGRGRS